MKKSIYLASIFTLLATHAFSTQLKPVLKPLLQPTAGVKLSAPLERKLSSVSYLHKAKIPPYLIVNPAMLNENTLKQVASTPSLPLLEDEPISLTDAKGNQRGQHSIMPSAITVLGSPAIVRAEERTIMYLRHHAQETSVAEYMPPIERERWKAEFEALRALYIKGEPTPLEELPQHFTHEVPPETAAYLKRQYSELVRLIEQTHRVLTPRIVYSYLQNEGRQFPQEEKVFINKAIDRVRTNVSVLTKAIKTDPYLLIQQKYWNRMFGAFNPLLKGVLTKPTSIFRQDNRPFVFQEFALHNPDGSAPYLPGSKTMIAGEDEEDDDFDDEQYAGQRQDYQRRFAKMQQERQHKAEMIKLAEQERDALLEKIPANLRIAVINDDRLPLINFEYWAKNGYLGKNAKVSTYKDGRSFMKQIKHGIRYDIVITDLLLPDGGVAMMEDFRLLDSKAIVFASSKFEPGDVDDHSARDLFNFGMDGYIWNNTNLNEGSFGYLQYLRQLNNYFYYRNKYNWDR